MPHVAVFQFTVCLVSSRYLFMHETCWALSADVSHLSVQLHS